MDILWIMLGAGLGSMSRLYISENVASIKATFLVNLIGSLVLSLSIILYGSLYISQPIYLIFALGFSGAFTTFSTFSYESFILLQEKKYKVVFLYVFGSIIIPLFLSAILLYPAF